ncbi:MAG TPA: 4-hydroxy-tetrahydrodipicolinate synthase, partial [Mycobacteriales bacterium]|nr:4-hydroxy-tetrahydrodipicolinate synthase [Mycobacteriales bacterium]
MSALPAAPFGRFLTAMVTPFTPDGALDLPAVGRLVQHLADHGHDGVVVSGTTGEASTTSDAEKYELLRAVLDAAGERFSVIAGAGTNDTAHGRELARLAAKAGAHGVLATTPYYSKPTQEGVIAHIEAIAAAADLPVMLYDVPARTGLALTTDTIVRLAGHPQIVALKDAKGDLAATGDVRRCVPDLAIYCGADEVNLPLLALGAVGVVSVLGHLAGSQIAAMIAAFDRGEVRAAWEIHNGLLPAARGLFRFASPAPTKAALADL